MNKSDIEAKIAALELEVNGASEKASNLKNQLTEQQELLESINKPKITSKHLEELSLIIENEINDFKFDEYGDFTYDIEIDYNNTVKAENIEFDSIDTLTELVVNILDSYFAVVVQ